MRISDWSSDVCSSDLDRIAGAAGIDAERRAAVHALGEGDEAHDEAPAEHDEQEQPAAPAAEAHLFAAIFAVFAGRNVALCPCRSLSSPVWLLPAACAHQCRTLSGVLFASGVRRQ